MSEFKTMNNKYTKILLLGLGLLVSANALAQTSNVGANVEMLHQAAYNREYERIEALLLVGTDINIVGDSLYGNGSALHVAVQRNYQDIAELLLKHGAVVDLRDLNDYTPLANAAWNGDLNMVKLLLDAGADINATNYAGHTPLSCARDNNKSDVVKFIEGKLQLNSN